MQVRICGFLVGALTLKKGTCSCVGQTTGLPLEFGHCSRASILKGWDHLAQQPLHGCYVRSRDRWATNYPRFDYLQPSVIQLFHAF